MDFKVGILPCNGVGRVVSTIARQAAYQIVAQRPNDTVLLSSSGIVSDVESATEPARKYPVLVLDGCRPHCGSGIARQKKLRVGAVLYIPDVMAAKGLAIPGERRTELSDRGHALVDAVVEHANTEIERILAEDMLSTL